MLDEAVLTLGRRDDADQTKVLQALQLAITHGSADATYALAPWYLFGKNVPFNLSKAARLLKDAAKNDLPKAHFDLTVCYEKGAGVRQSSRKAFEYYVAAALGGGVSAIHAFGRCFWHGLGTARDKRIAEI